jgi:hypothetical protein
MHGAPLRRPRRCRSALMGCTTCSPPAPCLNSSQHESQVHLPLELRFHGARGRRQLQLEAHAAGGLVCTFDTSAHLKDLVGSLSC